MSDQPTLDLPRTSGIKTIVDLLDDLGIDPLHLHCDGAKPLDSRPNVRLWLRYCTDYERVIDRLRLKSVERQYRMPGQREWYAERDNDEMRLLVCCVSFAHHPDWEARA